jgi:5-methylcytosine-specific restriction endonuclease McrA
MKKYRKTDNYKQYQEKNYEETREHRLEWKKKYYQENKEDRAKYAREYKQKNPHKKTQASIISYISQSLKKQKKCIEYLDCSWDVFYKHIEQQFLPEMNWENYGEVWEVDHIIPLSKEGSFNYKNTQPLFKTTKIAESFGYVGYIGNRNKSNKLL